MPPRRKPEPEDDDLEDLFDDAPDDLDDEDEIIAYFSARLDIEDDVVEDLVQDATQTAGILAAYAMLKLFSAGWDALDGAQDDATAAHKPGRWDALDGAQDDATAAHTEDVGPELTERLNDIAADMADDLDEKLDTDWGDEDGAEVTGLADINAQSEYSESKSDADVAAGWEYAQYLAEPDACDVCADCHGVILQSDDEWWDEHEPDNHHPNCKCLKVPLSEADADARGGVTKDLPDVEPGTWKDRWPPDVTDYPDVLEGIYHSKVS